jgi:hypothetical protein
MQLLNLFKTGGLTAGLTIVWALLVTWFLIQAIKAHNSGGEKQDLQNGPQYDKIKTPFYKIPQFWYAVGTTTAYIIALIAVASDYNGA